MRVVVFDTKEEAIESEKQDFAVFIASHQDEDYLEITTKWSEVNQMQDGRWYYAVCPACDYADRLVLDYEQPVVDVIGGAP